MPSWFWNLSPTLLPAGNVFFISTSSSSQTGLRSFHRKERSVLVTKDLSCSFSAQKRTAGFRGREKEPFLRLTYEEGRLPCPWVWLGHSDILHNSRPPHHVCLPVDRFAFRMKSAWLPLSCHSKHISPIVSSSIKERRDIKMSILWCWCKEEGKFWVWSPGIPPGAGKDSVHTSQITHSCASRRLLRSILGEFSDGPKARTWHLHCRGLSSVPCQGTKIPQVSRHSQEQKTPKQKKKSIFPGTSERSQTCWYGHHQNKREKSKQKGGKEVWITLYHEKFLTLDGPFYVNHTQVFFIRKAKPVSVWGQKRLRFTSYSAQRFELSAESQ